MVIDGRQIHSGFISDLAQRCVGESMLAEQAFSGAQDAFSGGMRFDEHDGNKPLKQTFQTIVSTCL